MENANLPDDIKSIWSSFSSRTAFPTLSSDTKADVCIIGGGITGISTAQLLKHAGFDVVVVEALSVGQGNTGHSTGNLYVAVEQGFDTIQSKYNTETLRTVINARGAALNMIADNVDKLSIDCDFKLRNWYEFSTVKEKDGKIEKILQAGRDARANVAEIGEGELPFKVTKGVRMPNQAQFNPLRYVQQLAVAIAGEGCRIFENSRVTDIIENKDETITVTTPTGNVTARYLVHATHTPKGIWLDFHSLLGTYREYGIAATLLSDDYPEGIFWGYFNATDRYSIRTYTHEGEKRIIVVGQPHEVGQKQDNTENIQNLEIFLREHFKVGSITNKWGGQNYKSADGLPYLGRARKGSNIFIATGMSTDGLTYGTLASIIIRDQMLNKETEFTKVFDATRHNPVKAAGKVFKENFLNVKAVVEGYISFNEPKLAEIPFDEGRVLEVDGKKSAVYRSPTGEYRACSAICTHLGCVVNWNKAEKTWDCPCHASRFNVDGGIIEGPALWPLEKFDITDK
jgi:glycine/D-amino acid oxidase-like deaminating enzyme/nitrite reductase/ring-hydroxylating ferredoxin subunit